MYSPGQSHAFIGQVGCQAPRFLVAAFPMDQQVDPQDGEFQPLDKVALYGYLVKPFPQAL
jgi:hypothetical protein